MNAPIWSFDQSREIVDRLCWGGPLHPPGGHSLENGLLQKLAAAVKLLLLDDEANASSLVDSPTAVKSQLLRHPYVAGFLHGHFKLNARELQSYLADFSPPTAGASSLSTIRIDRENSLSVPPLRDGREWLANYTKDEFDTLLHELKSALGNVALVSTSASDFITSYVWNLAIRKNTEKPDRFGTYTFPTLPGFLLICNSHSSAVDSFLLEETLVHEAIHCFLDWVEAAGPAILRDEQSDGRFVKSPWTGNSLDVPTAFHATLVWFGLGQYFEKCIALRLSKSHQARFASRLEFVRAGFQSTDLASLKEALMEACNEGASNVLSLAFERWH